MEEIVHKHSIINRIGDAHIINLKEFVIFEDAWISEHDEVLIDDNSGEEYKVLEYQKIREYVLESPEHMPYVNGWKWKSRSCVKLDKTPPLNARLYIKPIDYRKKYG